jgi:hypothetical protein
MKDGDLVTSGGRVLAVVGVAPNLPEARARAYEAVAQIHFEGMQYRTDIAANVRITNYELRIRMITRNPQPTTRNPHPKSKTLMRPPA